jgi:hypothetical protein
VSNCSPSVPGGIPTATGPRPAPLRVYIAGPISRGDLAHNITQATRAFVELARAGLAPWCPHWAAFSGGVRLTPSGTPYAEAAVHGCGLDHADWLRVDLAWMAGADAVLRLPGESEGADREVAEARRLGVPVFGNVLQVKLWADMPADGRRLFRHGPHGAGGAG